MDRAGFKRLRIIVLLLCLGVGVVGQVVSALAMPMPLQSHEDMTAASPPMRSPGECPACPHPGPATAPSCVLAFCSVLPAVLPLGPIVAAAVRVNFPPGPAGAAHGLTIRPDLGPPRFDHRI